MCRHSIGQTEIVGSSDSINQNADIALACERVDDIARIGIGGLTGETVHRGGVVETVGNPPDLVCGREAMKCLIDGVSGTEVGKVVLSPYAGACLGLDSVQYGVRYADSGGLHRRLMSEKM
jgi:hypothetical protein